MIQIRARPQLQQKLIMVAICLIATMMIVLPSVGVMALTPTPTHTPVPTGTPGPFSVNLNPVLSTASTLFNGLFPVFGTFIGLGLAFAIIGYIITEIRKAI